jgi:soluble lytic murein transglycosylase-like protein
MRNEERRRLVKIDGNSKDLNKLADQLKRKNLPTGAQDQLKFTSLLNAFGKAGQSKGQSEVKKLTPLTLEDYRNQAMPVRLRVFMPRVSVRSTVSVTRDDLQAPEQIQKVIEDAARKFNLPTKLVKAVIKVESNFDPRAVSPKGARGLMQLMPTTAEDLGVRNSFDIRENINGGCRYLRELLDRFDGNLKLAVAAYNAGPAAVEKYGRIPPYNETQDYVKKVLAFC